MPEEIKLEVIQKTQKTLGKYVKKPQLSEKLLKKPPFRFLHDIVNVVIKETGFLKGLFSDSELNSENVKERDAKIAFLTKLIEAVRNITNTELTVRPSKIIAGLEPTETNVLLQTIAKAIEKNLDSSEYIKKIKSSSDDDNNIKEKKTKKSEKTDKPKKESKIENKNEEKKKSRSKTEIETPKSTDRKQRNHSKSRDSKNKPETKQKKEKLESPKSNVIEEKPAEEISDKENQIKENEAEDKMTSVVLEAEKSILEKQSTPIIENHVIENKEPTPPPPVENNLPDANEVAIEKEERKRTPSGKRPKSARPKSGDRLKEPTSELIPPPTINKPKNRPKSTLRPPSVRPSSARPGAPRLRPDSALPMQEVMTLGKINVIVESFDKDTDDNEETLIIQTTPEIMDRQMDELDKIPDDNKGHLVEQILEQIEGDENELLDKKKKDDSKQDMFQVKDLSKETKNLKVIIQTLTKTANPLGKLLNYLHEDMEAMQTELETWTTTKKQLFAEIAKQKKISAELNKPLLAKLTTLNEEIQRVEEEIATVRSNILRNDIKIKKMLSKSN